MRVRTRQEIGKRLDLMAAIGGYRFGLRNAPPGFGGKFFFPPDEIPERITLLNEFLPAQVSQIISEADNICRHRFNLLGYPGLDYGEEIDWHLDAVHGKRAARRPWYWINYLNFAKAGDHKVIWELNRHQHLVTLAKAWSLTGETRYLAELIQQWHSWQAANRYPLGINWASSLEVAFRSLSWLWVANLLADSESAKDLLADLAGALALSGRHIERYLSTYFSPNTHLLGEGVGLFFIGTLCPKLANANRWKEKGWEIVVEASKRQVLADGMYFEQALHYHVYALDFFLHTRTLAAHNGMEITGEFDAVIQKMLDVLAALSQAGPAEGFGDDDGGRVFDPRRNRTEHMTDPLAMGASLYGEKYARGGAKLTEEAIWLFGKCAVEALREHATIRSQAFATGGLYVLASKEPCPQQMVVDAGPQGTGPSGHGHADALSLRMAVDGQRFLIDPGTCAYISDGTDRDSFRGTGAHNTVSVDEHDQATPAGPFAWTNIPNVRVERWVSGKSFDFLVANHDGYSRLPEPVLHRRFVFRIGGLWLVRDVGEGRGRHLLESFWHFADDIMLTHDNGAVIATSRKGPRLVFLNAHNSGFREEIGSGLVSPAYGIRKPAPMARISARTEVPADSAILMKGQRDASATGDFTQLMSSNSESPRAYRYASHEAVEEFIFSRAKQSWAFDNWNSDAEFLYCRSEKSRPKLLVMIQGSFVKWQKETLFSGKNVTEKIEWSPAEHDESSGVEELATTRKRLERL